MLRLSSAHDVFIVERPRGIQVDAGAQWQLVGIRALLRQDSEDESSVERRYCSRPLISDQESYAEKLDATGELFDKL
jgi:hypothetical protein